MARPKNATQSRSFEISVPADSYACLEHLGRLGRYGGNPAAVARYLLL